MAFSNYKIIGEVLKEFQVFYTEANFSDAEIITTAVCAAMFFNGNHHKACGYMKDHNLIPDMERKISI